MYVVVQQSIQGGRGVEDEIITIPTGLLNLTRQVEFHGTCGGIVQFEVLESTIGKKLN